MKVGMSICELCKILAILRNELNQRSPSIFRHVGPASLQDRFSLMGERKSPKDLMWPQATTQPCPSRQALNYSWGEQCKLRMNCCASLHNNVYWYVHIHTSNASILASITTHTLGYHIKYNECCVPCIIIMHIQYQFMSRSAISSGQSPTKVHAQWKKKKKDSDFIHAYSPAL